MHNTSGPLASSRRDESTVYCSSAVTAPVKVDSCINVPGAVWWLKVMNPLEEMHEIIVNDVLGFTEKCMAPEVDDE